MTTPVELEGEDAEFILSGCLPTGEPEFIAEDEENDLDAVEKAARERIAHEQVPKVSPGS